MKIFSKSGMVLPLLIDNSNSIMQFARFLCTCNIHYFAHIVIIRILKMIPDCIKRIIEQITAYNICPAFHFTIM